MSRYHGDPYWLEARYPGSCAGCGERFQVGTPVFYYPLGKACYAGTCGTAAARDFESLAQDEETYSYGAYGV